MFAAWQLQINPDLALSNINAHVDESLSSKPFRHASNESLSRKPFRHVSNESLSREPSRHALSESLSRKSGTKAFLKGLGRRLFFEPHSPRPARMPAGEAAHRWKPSRP